MELHILCCRSWPSRLRSEQACRALYEHQLCVAIQPVDCYYTYKTYNISVGLIVMIGGLQRKVVVGERLAGDPSFSNGY